MSCNVWSLAGEGKMSGAGGGKRPSGGDSPPGPPEKKSKKEEKTTTTLIEPIRIAGVSSTVSYLVPLPSQVILCSPLTTTLHSNNLQKLFLIPLIFFLCRRKWTWRCSSSRIRSCVSAWSRDRRWRMSYERKLKSWKRGKPLTTPPCWLSTATGRRYDCIFDYNFVTQFSCQSHM